jgi:hypothetical protein
VYLSTTTPSLLVHIPRGKEKGEEGEESRRKEVVTRRERTRRRIRRVEKEGEVEEGNRTKTKPFLFSCSLGSYLIIGLLSSFSVGCTPSDYFIYLNNSEVQQARLYTDFQQFSKRTDYLQGSTSTSTYLYLPLPTPVSSSPSLPGSPPSSPSYSSSSSFFTQDKEKFSVTFNSFKRT